MEWVSIQVVSSSSLVIRDNEVVRIFEVVVEMKGKLHYIIAASLEFTLLD